MNPFDLRGPEFLAFYVGFAAIVLLTTWILRRALDPSGAPPRISDPYALALVRGGRAEAVKTAVLALSQRGAVEVSTSFVKTVQGATFKAGLESALGASFATPRLVASATSDVGVSRALRSIEDRLESAGLIPDAAATARRLGVLLVAEGLLLGVAGAKIVIAIQRGHSNVLFLVLLSCLAAFLAFRAAFPRATPKGLRLLADLRTLLLPLQKRTYAKAARTAPDWADNVSMLAAVYGPSAIPSPASSVKLALWPPPPQTSSSYGSSGFSSCGTSSSCGGGCGGGGCGGCGS